MDGESAAVTNIAKVLAELLDISVLVDQNRLGQALCLYDVIIVRAHNNNYIFLQKNVLEHIYCIFSTVVAEEGERIK